MDRPQVARDLIDQRCRSRGAVGYGQVRLGGLDNLETAARGRTRKALVVRDKPPEIRARLLGTREVDAPARFPQTEQGSLWVWRSRRGTRSGRRVFCSNALGFDLQRLRSSLRQARRVVEHHVVARLRDHQDVDTLAGQPFHLRIGE